MLFSLEQLSYYFPDKTMWQSFVCAMVAAVTLQAFNPFRTGKLVLYQVTYHSGWHDFEPPIVSQVSRGWTLWSSTMHASGSTSCGLRFGPPKRTCFSGTATMPGSAFGSRTKRLPF